MKKNLLLSLSLFFSFLLIIGCSDDNDNLLPVDDEWKALNEAKIEEITKDPGFTALKALNEEGYIYYKVLESGDESEELIRYDDIVYSNYEGYLMDDTLFESQNIINKPLTSIQVSGNTFVSGMQTALQYMRKGDKWEIWIPANLAYGRMGSVNSRFVKTVPPYSALHYTIEVIKVERQ